MIIFNNGKYKSILAAEKGELAEIAETVQKDNDFRPHFHIAPPTGLMNDPNGLIFDGEKYHLFYQWFPFDAIHGMKHWKHLITKDFQHYQSAEDLIPCELFESHGCYSGGALKVGDKLAMFYTGNTRRPSDNQRVPYQNLAIFDLNGKLLSKRPLIENAPEGYTEHVRDPKPYFTEDGKIRFICGAQRENLTGTAIIFEMDNLEDTPRLLGELSLPAFDNKNVFMWECPDLLKLGDKDVFIWSPQGKDREAHQFQNNYHATYAVGKLTDLTFEAEYISELDQGFDFYAPQTFEDESGRRILIGWMGIPDADYTNPTEEAGWQHALTIPRELSVRDGKLIQEPIEELKQLRSEDKAVCTFCYGQTIIMQNAIYEAVVDFKRCREMVMTLREGITLSYKDNILTLNLGVYGSGRSTRKVRLEKLEHLQIFADTSSLEIFVNHGEEVFTTRIYNHYGRLLINGECSGIMTVYPLKSFEIEGGRHEE